MRAISNMRIGIKTQFATVAIVVLLAVVAVSVTFLRIVLKTQVDVTVSTTMANVLVNRLGGAVQQYMAGALSFADLQKEYDSFQAAMKDRYPGVLARKLTVGTDAKDGGGATTATLGDHFDELWMKIQLAETLVQDEAKISGQVQALSNDAIGKSSDYLASISERLADPVQQKKVSILERRVIQGASINTNSNFTVQVLFRDMKSDVSSQDKLFQFLDQAQQNATTDAGRLAGTPFAQLPQDSLAAIVQIRDLAQHWVKDEGTRQQISVQATDKLARLMGAMSDVLVQGTLGSFSRVLSIMTVALAAFVVLVALVVAMQLLVSRSITRPLVRGMAFAQSIAGGDFTQALAVTQKDEIGKLSAALEGMREKLRDMVSAVRGSAGQVAASSQQITVSAQKLAEGAQSQASTLEETSASVEQLTASVDQVSGHAQSQAAAVEKGTSSMAEVHRSIDEVSRNLTEIAALTATSVELAVDGAKAVSEVVGGINLIAGSSEKIGGIVGVISDIADQTNLLALNAAIEAARAGEHGRGFAVVADEVSKLAERSSSSTKEIVALIKESVRNVTRGVETARDSQEAMEQIRAASQKVREMTVGLSSAMTRQVGAVAELSGALATVSEMSRSISAATLEQTTSAKQVSKAVENVNDITQEAASAAEEMSAATQQLSGMAQQLEKLVEQFKIAEGSAASGHARPAAMKAIAAL